MKINFMGDDNFPKILFIYPLGFDKSSFDEILNTLKKDYYLCLIQLDNGDDEFVYNSAKYQAAKIEKELNLLKIDNFKLLFSLSLSGITAMQLYINDNINFQYCILDGVPMLNIGVIKENILFSMIIKEKNNIYNSIKENDEKLDKYMKAQINTFVKTVKNMKEDSIKTLLNESVRFSFPKLSTKKQEKLYIRYGEFDFAYKSINILKTKYTKSNLYVKKACNHCQEIIEQKDNYLKFIYKVISQ